MKKGGRSDKKKAVSKDEPKVAMAHSPRLPVGGPPAKSPYQMTTGTVPQPTVPLPVDVPSSNQQQPKVSLFKKLLIALSLPLAGVGIEVTSTLPPVPAQAAGQQAQQPQRTNDPTTTTTKVTITFPRGDHNDGEISKAVEHLEHGHPDVRVTWQPGTFTLEITIIGIASAETLEKLGKWLGDAWDEHHRRSGGPIDIKTPQGEIHVERREDLAIAVQAIKDLQGSRRRARR